MLHIFDKMIITIYRNADFAVPWGIISNWEVLHDYNILAKVSDII